MVTLAPVVQASNLYINGGVMSWTSTTTVTISDIECRDSTNTFDIDVNTGGVGTVLSGAVNGLNGLDTGTIAASTMYSVYAIYDQSGYNVSGFIMSLNNSAPQMPAGLNPSGYSSWRFIGSLLTNSSSQFALFYNFGINSSRYTQYDAPVTVTVTGSGTSTTYLALDLSVAVPLVSYGRVQLGYQWTNNAAADIVNFQPTGATGNAYSKKGIAAGVQQDENLLILPLIAAAKPEISYKTSTGGSTLNTVNVQGYEFNL